MTPHGLALLLGTACAALAQGPVATVQITAPTLRVIAGERLRLTAVGRDANGVARPNDTVLWSVNNTNLGLVSLGGELSTNTLGIIQVSARIGNITSTMFIQILPKKINVTPAEATVAVGQQMQFRAEALDINDRPLPNVTFRWFTSSMNLGTTNTASVTNQGMLSTVAVGRILVRASYDYNTGVPGFERQAQDTATVTIRPPQNYRLSRVIGTNDPYPGQGRLRARVVPLLGNERGQVLFNANFDGMASGPLLIENGVPKLLMSTGMAGVQPQSQIGEFSQLAMNNRGEVLALTSMLGVGNAIFKIGADGPDPVFVDTSPLPGTEFLSGAFLNRNCLNDNGTWAFRANYRVQNAGPTITAIFRVPTRGFPNEVVSTVTALPDFPATFSLDNDFGIAGNDLMYFTATSGTRRALFVDNFGEIRKLLEIGMPLNGSTVSRFIGNAYWANGANELVVSVGLANNQVPLLRFDLTDLNAAPKSVALTTLDAIYANSPVAGTLFRGNFNNRGYGLWIWPRSGDPQLLFLQNNNAYQLRGRAVTQIDFATMNAQGLVTVIARTNDNPMEIFTVTSGNPAQPLLAAGDVVPVNPTLTLINVLNGDRMGNAHVLVGSRGSSIFEVNDRSLRPVYLLGEQVTGINLHTGSNVGDARKAPGGDVFVSQTNGQGMYRIRGGAPEFVQRAGYALEAGTTGNAPQNVIATNSHGGLLWQASTNRGDTRLFQTGDGGVRPIATNSVYAPQAFEVDGKTVTGWADMAMDDNGRVMGRFTFRDGSPTAFYLYSDGVWRHVATAGETMHNGSLVVGISQVRSAGDAFYAIFNLQGLGNHLVRWRSGGFETVLHVSEPLVTGHLVGSVGNYDVNRKGEVVAQCNPSPQVLVVKKGNQTQYIHMLNELTPDGDLLTRTSDFDIRDDGTVYFLAMTVMDEYVLYKATPVQ
ncbi:MAG: hypothetical protein JNK87_23555 [Bryobacterales bacterium]|nr:hypothetical protein [Bryobacterales bacterium]